MGLVTTSPHLLTTSNHVLTASGFLITTPNHRPHQARRELEEACQKGGESAETAREYWMRILPEAVVAFDAQVWAPDKKSY